MSKVLSLVWYKILPAHFGGQKGIALFSKYLSRHLSLDMLCAETNIPEGNEGYSVIPLLPASKTQFIDPYVWGTICRTIEKGNYTHLLIEHCYYGWIGKALKKKYGLPLIVHSHNIEHLRFRQLGKWWWPVLKRIERSAHRAADLSLFKTEDDLRTAVEVFHLDPSLCMEVPYGLELHSIPDAVARAEARKLLDEIHPGIKGKKILLFNGTLDYQPNADAVKQLVFDIAPKLHPDQVIIVCGRVMDESFMDIKTLKAPNYIYAGYVDEINTYFKGADAFVNPVSTGGGVKVKVMEALSYGLPVVSYASGATGIRTLLTGDQLKLVPDHDIHAFIAAIANLEYQPSIGEAFFHHYHWDTITTRVAERIRVLG